jgi:predicted SnoaL-like aldol condensation-catalyzing enzyme
MLHRTDSPNKFVRRQTLEKYVVATKNTYAQSTIFVADGQQLYGRLFISIRETFPAMQNRILRRVGKPKCILVYTRCINIFSFEEQQQQQIFSISLEY